MTAPTAGIRVLSVLFVTALTAALSQVSFPLPLTPVPFTLQPMVVLLGGAALGARLGATSQILYLMLGAAGLPVFAYAPELPQGLLRLIGPSGGYLMAYPLAAFVTGWLAQRGMDRRVGTSILAMAAGLGVVFAGGVLWLAKDLGVDVGDKIRVRSSENRDELLDVKGVFDIGNRDLNRRWVFTTIKLAQSLLDLPGGVSNVDITVNDIFAADRVAALLRAQTGLTVESWMQTNAQLLAALRNQSVSNTLIRVFVVLIVAVGIASVLVVSVVQKQREIGILRAMGTSPRRIMTVFLLQGGIYGLVGSVIGSGLAFGLLSFFAGVYRNADGSSLFAAELDPMVVLRVCGLALAIGLLAAALPARRAARMDPVQAIRM